MRTLVIDNHILFREGLASMLSGQPDFTVVGVTGSISEGVSKSVSLKPDLVLLDIDFPGGFCLDAIKEINQSLPGTKVVVLTSQESDDLVFSAIRMGARGYLQKSISIHKLLASLRGLNNHDEMALSRVMAGRVIREFNRLGSMNDHAWSEIPCLTAREIEVLTMLGTGCSNRDIADNLVISSNTVKIHVHNILKKLGVRSRREAANLARRKLLPDVK